MTCRVFNALPKFPRNLHRSQLESATPSDDFPNKAVGARLLALSISLIVLLTSGSEAWAKETTPPRKKWLTAAELGLNSLAGMVGIFGSYDYDNHLSLDTGIGPSIDGLRVGLRPRYSFGNGNQKIFVAAGPLLHVDYSNFKKPAEDIDSTRGHPLGLSLQAVLGVITHFEDNLTVLFSLGWSHAFILTYDTASLVYLTEKYAPNSFNNQDQKSIFISGPVFAATIGTTF